MLGRRGAFRIARPENGSASRRADAITVRSPLGDGYLEE
jgi:hypothetical protein